MSAAFCDALPQKASNHSPGAGALAHPASSHRTAYAPALEYIVVVLYM